MKTTNYVIYIYIYRERERERERERSNSSWLENFLGTEKNSLKHHAAKIQGGQPELPEQRYLKMTVLIML